MLHDLIRKGAWWENIFHVIILNLKTSKRVWYLGWAIIKVSVIRMGDKVSPP